MITFPGGANSQRPIHRRFAGTIEKLIQELSPQITTIPTLPFLPLNALHLENSLFEPGNHSVESAKNAFLLEARSPAEEAREALRWIKACVLREGIALSDCAVFTPNADAYNPFIRAIATEFGIPIHFTQGAALAASPAMAALHNLLTLPAQNFKTRMLFNSLRSPYFDFGLDANIVNELEEIGRRARIIESQEQWQETWERLIPSETQDQSDLDDERILPSLPRGDKTQSLRYSLQACFDMFITPIQIQSYTGWVTWLEDVLERLNFYRNAENERDEMACEVFRETLRALVLSESITGKREADYASFLSTLQSTLNGIGLPEPRLTQQPALLIGRMVEARGICFKAVALLGFSEGLFPEAERPDPFLDESLRQRLGLEQRLDREQAGLFYQAVTRTDQYLLITRPYLSDKGENWEASPFWKDVQKRFDKSALRVVRPDDVPPLNDAASSQELLFWAVRHKGLPGRFRELEPRWQTLRHARDVLRARRAKRPEGTHEGFVTSIALELSKRYAPDKVWSASRLEAYGNCPQQFYVKAALGLEPRTIPELGMDVSQFGILLHKILEETYLTATNPSDASSLLAILPDVAHRLFISAPDKYGFRPSSLWTFEQEQLLVKLQATIEALCNEDDGWTPIAYEQKFGIDSFPPLEVNLGTEKILLHGVIDRLDRNVNGEIRIVDYKAGSSHLDPKALKNGTRLQLPLYALAVRNALHLGNVSEGIYWKIQGAEAGSLKLSRYKSDDGLGVDAAIQAATKHLLRIVTGIRAAEFPPLPPKGGCPSYCPAAQWCWHYEAGWGSEK
ncbi:MAG: exodeoxyribonuclease V subunit gamma [Nitrospira sp.]